MKPKLDDRNRGGSNGYVMKHTSVTTGSTKCTVE